MKYRYVPMLRAKAGEGVALTNLDPAAKARMFPVVHLAADVPTAFGTKAAVAWAGLPMGLDGAYHEDFNGNISEYIKLFDLLGAGGVHVIPSFSCSAPTSYNSSVKPLIGKYAGGAVIKTGLSTVRSASTLVASLGVLPRDIDLVVDLQDISAVFTDEWADFVGDRLKKITSAALWRSISLAASAAPKDHGSLSTGRNLVARNDWKLWNSMYAEVDYKLDYGDYTTLHPDLTDPPGAAMARATVSVRYSAEENWIIYKGTPTSGARGQPMPGQYSAHARALVGEPEFECITTSWGDARIRQIAAGAPKSGSRASWAEIAINRHLTLVAAQLP